MLRQPPLKVFLLCISALLGVAGSAQAALAQGSSLRAEDARIAAIVHRIAAAGAPLCRVRAPLTGLLLHYLAEYDAEGRRRLVGSGLDRGPGVLTVVPGSAADRAGLIAGDVLLAANGVPFPLPATMLERRNRDRWRALADGGEEMLHAALSAGAARLLLLRGGEELEVNITAPSACPSRIRLVRSKERNAYADGRTIILTTALTAFARSDDELAVIITHELAHNALGHRATLDALGVPQGRARERGAHAARVRVTEEEADRLGLRLAAAGGFDPVASIQFWRRLYADRGRTRYTTHPDLAAREALIRAELAVMESEALRR